MFSLHSFFLLFFPTSAFVPATVFWLPFFLLWACLSPWLRWPSQLTFFLISAPLWQRADTTWGDLQAVTGYCTRSKSASSIWGLSQFHMQGTTWHLPASASSITNTHTYTHTHTHTHTYTLLWASANSGQGSAQLKLIRTLGNDSVNTRSLFLMIFSITKDFPLSHACLFFQIARKDINNVILPSK